MMRRRRTRNVIAWVTLAAMLFSALSPAMASVLFADRPTVLARMLALPAASPGPDLSDICHPVTVDGVLTKAGGADSDEVPTHPPHGIYCSFCLTANSSASLPPIVGSVATFPFTAHEPPPAPRARRPLAFAPVVHHSRGPPASPLAR